MKFDKGHYYTLCIKNNVALFTIAIIPLIPKGFGLVLCASTFL